MKIYGKFVFEVIKWLKKYEESGVTLKDTKEPEHWTIQKSPWREHN